MLVPCQISHDMVGNTSKAMECSVCYCETGSFCKLTCGHSFCTGCIKTWYLKGSGMNTSCPMCRRPMYFRGFHKVRDEWDEELWENRCADAYGQAIDEIFEDAVDFASGFRPKMAQRIMFDMISDIKDIERTYNFLKSQEVSSEDIEYVLMETDEYFSDRHADKCFWIDEPVKKFETRYPQFKTNSRGGKRSRALEDEWCTLNFLLIL